MHRQDKSEKKHGNKAKANPEKHVEGAFVTNAAARTDERAEREERARQAAVEYAKRFVEENKK